MYGNKKLKLSEEFHKKLVTSNPDLLSGFELHEK